MLLKLSRSEQLEVEKKEKEAAAEGMEAVPRLSLGGAGEQQKQMTNFYKDRVCVCYATESQAEAIISIAKSETTEEELKSAMDNSQQQLRYLQRFRARIRDASACPYAAAVAAAVGCRRAAFWMQHI
ncbi:uncharacterized protein LOC141834457 [Curcuma longa]|uniref:uncharacterized protein LOC141834457 n=1 Tax=Curcuma longa TaxID=136217 RepID=UPI003D9EA5E9